MECASTSVLRDVLGLAKGVWFVTFFIHCGVADWVWGFHHCWFGLSYEERGKSIGEIDDKPIIHHLVSAISSEIFFLASSIIDQNLTILPNWVAILCQHCRLLLSLTGDSFGTWFFSPWFHDCALSGFHIQGTFLLESFHQSQ